MKKYIALLLALLAVFALSACKLIEKEPHDTTDPVTGTTEPEETSNTEPEETTEPVITTEADTTAPDTTEPEETTAEDTTAPEETTAEDTTAEDTTAPDTTKPEETTAPITEINSETAVRIAKDYLGESDPDTGYRYSYQYVETTDEGDFKIKVSWYLPEDERYSTCGYLLVSPEGEVTKFDW